MPVLLVPVPLIINMMISFSIWTSEISIVLKIVLTVATVVKFSAYFCSVFFTEKNRIKYSGFLACALMNVLLLIIGLLRGVIGLVVYPIILTVMILTWVILPQLFVKEKKEGSKQ